MKASELRIGNYVNLYGSLAQIQRADFSECKCSHGVAIEEGKPIPLTKEWLLKFGFSITENEADILVNNRYNLRVTDLGYISIQKITTMINLMVCCEYVHQLQNLYFALTGEELTVKGK